MQNLFKKRGMKIATKPFRAAGGAAFGAWMTHRAKDGRSEKQKIAEKYNNLLEAKDNIANNLSHIKEDIVDAAKHRGSEEGEERYQSLLELEAEAKKEQRKNQAKIAQMESDQITIRDMLKARMSNVLDAKHYTEKRKGGRGSRAVDKLLGTNFSREKMRRKKKKTEWVEGKLFARQAKDGTKSVGEVLKEQLNAKNFWGLSSKDQEILKQGTDLIKSATLGFVGCMVGLPLMIDEPAIGLPILAAGIKSSGKVWGRKVAKPKLEKDKRKYKFNRFSYTAMKTIKDQAIAETEEVKDEIAVRNVKRKHGKLYNALTMVGSTIKVVTLGTLALPTLGLTSTGRMVTSVPRRLFRNVRTTASNYMFDVNMQHMKNIDKLTDSLNKEYVMLVAEDLTKLYETTYSEASTEIREETENMSLEQLLKEHQTKNEQAIEVDGTHIILPENFIVEQEETETSFSEIENSVLVQWMQQLPEEDIEELREYIDNLSEQGNIQTDEIVELAELIVQKVTNIEQPIIEQRNNEDISELVEKIQQLASIESEKETGTLDIMALIKESEEIRKRYETENIQAEDDRKKPIKSEESEETTQKQIKIIPIKADEITKAMDDAIIEVALEQGIMDISRMSLNDSSTMEHVKVTMSRIMDKRGLKGVGTDIDSRIKELENKIESRKEILDKGRTSVTEQRKVTEAFKEVIQERGITNPKKMTEEDLNEVAKRATEKIAKVEERGISESERKTKTVLEQLKPTDPIIPIERPEERFREPEVPESIETMVEAVHESINVVEDLKKKKMTDREIKELKEKRIVREENRLQQELLDTVTQSEEVTETAEVKQVPKREDLQIILEALQENNILGEEYGVKVRGRTNKNKNQRTMKMPVEDTVEAGDRRVDTTVTGDREVNKTTTGDRRFDSTITGDRGTNAMVTGDREFDTSRDGSRRVGEKTLPVTDIVDLIYSNGKKNRNGEKK